MPCETNRGIGYSAPKLDSEQSPSSCASIDGGSPCRKSGSSHCSNLSDGSNNDSNSSGCTSPGFDSTCSPPPSPSWTEALEGTDSCESATMLGTPLSSPSSTPSSPTSSPWSAAFLEYQSRLPPEYYEEHAAAAAREWPVSPLRYRKPKRELWSSSPPPPPPRKSLKERLAFLGWGDRPVSAQRRKEKSTPWWHVLSFPTFPSPLSLWSSPAFFADPSSHDFRAQALSSTTTTLSTSSQHSGPDDVAQKHPRRLPSPSLPSTFSSDAWRSGAVTGAGGTGAKLPKPSEKAFRPPASTPCGAAVPPASFVSISSAPASAACDGALARSIAKPASSTPEAQAALSGTESRQVGGAGREEEGNKENAGYTQEGSPRRRKANKQRKRNRGKKGGKQKETGEKAAGTETLPPLPSPATDTGAPPSTARAAPSSSPAATVDAPVPSPTPLTAPARPRGVPRVHFSEVERVVLIPALGDMDAGTKDALFWGLMDYVAFKDRTLRLMGLGKKNFMELDAIELVWEAEDRGEELTLAEAEEMLEAARAVEERKEVKEEGEDETEGSQAQGTAGKAVETGLVAPLPIAVVEVEAAALEPSLIPRPATPSPPLGAPAPTAHLPPEVLEGVLRRSTSASSEDVGTALLLHDTLVDPPSFPPSLGSYLSHENPSHLRHRQRHRRYSSLCSSPAEGRKARYRSGEGREEGGEDGKEEALRAREREAALVMWLDLAVSSLGGRRKG